MTLQARAQRSESCFEEDPVEETQRSGGVPRLLRSIDERYPSVVYLSLAFFLAWQRAIAPLVWNGQAPWFGRTQGLHAYSLCSHAVLGAAVIVGVLVGVAAGRLGPARMGGWASLILSGAIGLLGSALTMGALFLALPIGWFGVGCALGGFGMGLLLVRCMVFYSAVSPSRVLMLTAGSWALGFAIDVLLKSTPVVAGACGYCLLPVLAALTLGVGGPLVGTGNRPEATSPSSHRGLGLPTQFWRFVGTVFLVALVSQTVVFFNSHNDAERRALVSYSSVAVVLIAAALMAYAAVSPRSYRYSRLYHPVMLAVLVLLGILLVTPEGKDWALVVSFAAYQLFALLVWCLLSCTAGRFGGSAPAAFGIGYALEQVGAVGGYLLGAHLMALDTLQDAAAVTGCLVAAMVVLALAMMVFPPHALNELVLALPKEDEEPTLGVQRTDAWDAASVRVAQKAGLTAREREVMVLLARGRGGDYVAESLGVSVSTVYTHTHNIYHKLDVHSREELMQRVDSALEGGESD